MSEKLETMTPELKAFIEEWKSKPWRRSTAW